jgi:hypothetical protein
MGKNSGVVIGDRFDSISGDDRNFDRTGTGDTAPRCICALNI